MTDKFQPSRHIAQNLLFIQNEIARDTVMVLTRNQLSAIAARRGTSAPLDSRTAMMREFSIANTHKAQQLRLNKKRCRRILPRMFVPLIRRTSLMCATDMSIQYMISVGPGPKYKRDKITKTSPIDTTEEILGSRTLIVETNTETQVRITHVMPNSAGLTRQ